jgi:hypothetical protein
MMNGRLDLHIDEYDEWKRKEEHLEEHDKQWMNMKNVDEQLMNNLQPFSDLFF